MRARQRAAEHHASTAATVRGTPPRETTRPPGVGEASPAGYRFADIAVTAPGEPPRVVQRTCSACQRPTSSPVRCERCGDAVPGVVDEALRTPGQPLAAGRRAPLEAGFGVDFSRVRIHTDARAAASARAVDARAFTVGHHVVLGSGESLDADGGRLLAHELAHVVQQSGSPGLQRRGIGSASDPAEAEADAAAEAIVAGKAAHIASRSALPRIQRTPRRHPRDRCDDRPKPADPCAAWSTEQPRALLAPHVPAYGDDAALFAVGNVFELSPREAPPRERRMLLRTALCGLEPEQAASLREVLVERRGTTGRAFGELHTATRCELLHILDVRAAVAGSAQGAAVRQRIESEVHEKETARAEELRQERARREQEQFQRDRALHAKAGKLDVLGALLPAHTGRYRIRYSGQIQNPLYKFSAEVAERGASVPLAAAALEPIARPIASVLEMFSCIAAALRADDAEALADRFDLSLGLVFPMAFSPGVIAGATEEIVKVAKAVADIVSDPFAFVDELGRLIELLWSPDSFEMACALGADIGGELSAEMVSMASMSDPELAFEIGKKVGPLVLYTALSLVAPHVVASLKGVRVLKRFLAFLEKIRGKLPWLDKWSKRNRIQGGSSGGSKPPGSRGDVPAHTRNRDEPDGPVEAPAATRKEPGADDQQVHQTNQGRPGRPGVRPSKPPGWAGSFGELGDRIGWPERNVKRPGEPGRHERPVEELDLSEIRATGIDESWAREQADVYRQIADSAMGRNNPSAKARSEWLETLAERLRTEP